MTSKAAKNRMGAVRSVKKNYIFNLCSQICSVIIPLITTPYIARVLSPEGVGQYAYAYSIIQYFVLFATFGFNLYGQREIAKYQDDAEKQSKLLVEIIFARLTLVAVALAAELVITLSGGFSEYTTIMFVLWVFILSVAFDISFFFQGNEEFGIIAFLNIFVRLISLAAIFIFVKKPDHVWIYAIIMSLSGFFSYALSWLFLPKRFKRFRGRLDILVHYKKAFVFFVPAIAISIYTILDKTLIGFITGSDAEVGFYEQADKIMKISLMAVTTLGTVMMSRNSIKFQQRDHEGVRQNIYNTCSFVLFLAVPMALGLIAVSPNLIPWFLGEGYAKSITLLMILCATLIPIGISNVIGIQYLIPCGKEKYYTISVIIGAAVNVLLNIPLIIFFQSIGAAIGSVAAEFAVLTAQLVFTRKVISVKKILLKSVKFFAGGLAMFAALYLIGSQLAPTIYWTLILLVTGVIIYFIVLYLLRDPFLLQMINAVKGKIVLVFNKRKKGVQSEMKITESGLKGVYIVEPAVFGDGRGWFMETFRDDKLKEAGIDLDFVQDNQSFSAKKGTLRGIHFQNYPYAQSKLVRCLRGEILDVAVDLRDWSPNYKKWMSVVLSAENKKQLFVPRGFGHAFLTLTDDAEVAYKTDEYYNKASEGALNYADKSVDIDWKETDITLSDKDKAAPMLPDAVCNFGARVLVTGVKGQLGYDVVKILTKKGIENVGVDIADFDLTDGNAVIKYIEAYRPTVIVHCAAYTAVDKAEDDREKCFAVNVTGTKNIAKAAKKLGAKLLYVSTDYVYGGEGDRSFKETDAAAPKNVYGMTKKQGEDEVISITDKHFIVRTSWVFGKNGNNFVKTMLRLAKEKPELTVVNDQIGSPTYTPDLAALIVEMIFTEKYGIYNVSNEGYCSWKEFAEEIFRQAGAQTKVLPVESKDYPAKAARPLNSRLDKTNLDLKGFKRLPEWRDALERYLKEIN